MNAAIGDMWSSMSSWFSPTVLFCLLNLVIGAIFLSSNLKSHNKNPPHQNQNQPDDYNPHQNQSQNQNQPDDYRANFWVVKPQVHSNQEYHHQLTRSKSDTTGEGEGHVAAAAAERMRKSASEKWRAEEKAAEEELRRPATVREGKRTASFFGEDEEVDEKADDFINKFKQQLKLERLEPLLNVGLFH